MKISPTIITSGLVFYFDFADRNCYPATLTSTYDLISSSLIGELTNSGAVGAANPTFDASNGGYLTFNGSSSILRFPNSTLLDSSSITVEAWVKTNSLNQNGFFFEKGQVNTQYSLYQEGTSLVFRTKHTDATLDSLLVDSATYISTSSFAHIVGTYTNGSKILYVNAVSVNSNTKSINLSTDSGGMSVGVHGGYAGSRGYYYNGSIASVKIYNRVLSLVEIQRNFKASKSRFGLK